MIEATLTAAAFGGQPGCWPLPTASTPHQHWLRAVAAGGQGRYGSARADLQELLRSTPAGGVVSLAHSTHGSFLRQLGWHRSARRWDGRALTLAGADAEARADALIGLAADALGIGRFDAAATLLSRVEQDSAQRLAVRRNWVAAELAMATGAGEAAVRHAEAAAELAATPMAGAVSERHRVKSVMILAAALCSVGHLDRARRIGDTALEDAGRLGLTPLRWALACLLLDIGSATHSAPAVQTVRDSCADQVRRAGGNWSRATT